MIAEAAEFCCSDEAGQNPNGESILGAEKLVINMQTATELSGELRGGSHGGACKSRKSGLERLCLKYIV